MTYTNKPRNVLSSGLTLLQVNPDCAAQLNIDSKDYGWLYIRNSDNKWITYRKLKQSEIEEANDQAADMVVLHGTKVRT